MTATVYAILPQVGDLWGDIHTGEVISIENVGKAFCSGTANTGMNRTIPLKLFVENGRYRKMPKPRKVNPFNRQLAQVEAHLRLRKMSVEQIAVHFGIVVAPRVRKPPELVKALKILENKGYEWDSSGYLCCPGGYQTVKR